jgi:hypothetical protein
VTRYLFEPVVADTTYSYFDLLYRDRLGEFPSELRVLLGKALLARVS